MSRLSVLAVVAVAGVLALTASANLLVNPGFETGAGFGATPDGWWKYNEAGQETWAWRTGTNGMAFWSWSNGTWGGFGQDVVSNVQVGAVLTFSIYGLAEADFQSTEGETWLKVEYWNGGSLLGDSGEYNVYSTLTGGRDNWHLLTFVTTNTLSGVTTVKPIVGGGSFTNVGGSQSVKWDDADFTIGDAIPEPTIAGLLGFAGLLIAALRRKATK